MNPSSSLEEIFQKAKEGDVALFGDPVGHSLSPLLQNAAFQTWWGAFRDWDKQTPKYHKIRVRPSELKTAVELIKKYRFRGFNVTIPHKVAVCQYVDVLDPFAKKVGAVNTVALSRNRLKGFNTDGDGFRSSVESDLGFEFDGKKVLILGSGGTGRVIVQKSLELGSTVTVWNRSKEKADALVGSIRNARDSLKSADDKNVSRISEEADLVVNATSAGLSPEDGVPAPNLKFHSGQCVFDVIYNRETRFLQEAAAAGAKVAGGLSMLVYQGARSFEIWTGAPAPRDIMWQALSNSFREKKGTN